MSEDSFRFHTPLFGVGLTKRDNEIKLKEGESVILRYWSWRKFGYIRKLVRIVDGKVEVTIL
jgi:hypothetical protein